MQGEMSQGRNVAQGEMLLREKCRREKSRREKCRREKCLSGRNVVQSRVRDEHTLIFLQTFIQSVSVFGSAKGMFCP